MKEQKWKDLVAERMKLRSEVVQHLARFAYHEAVAPVSNLVSKSEQVYHEFKTLSELYELLADQLLRVKVLIKTNQAKLACSKLNDVFNTIKLRMEDEPLKILHQQTLMSENASNQEEIEKKNIFMSEIRKRCNLISLVANLFYSLGYPKDCEEAYVRYIKLIENVFGPDVRAELSILH